MSLSATKFDQAGMNTADESELSSDVSSDGTLSARFAMRFVGVAAHHGHLMTRTSFSFFVFFAVFLNELLWQDQDPWSDDGELHVFAHPRK
jgi:hypothetical protein